MALGLIGRKCGMTRLFADDGATVPVTVIEALPNRVTQLKTLEKEGYTAVQVTRGLRRKNRVTKAMVGHCAKASVPMGSGLWEFPMQPEEMSALKLGGEITTDIFQEGQVVDVTGVTKGKGFAGVVKRHHFAMQDATHGNSLSHRVHGSTGQRQTPGRVFKGKKMAGHLGNVQRTVQNQVIVAIDKERHLIFIRGVVPGAPAGHVVVKPAVKKPVNQLKG